MSAKRITITPSDELEQLIIAYQIRNELNSKSAAVIDLLGVALEEVNGTRPRFLKASWGGVRHVINEAEYTQCKQCGGWNVGEYEGHPSCADCGWNGEDA